MRVNYFGLHLILDAYGASYKQLAEKKLIKDFLNNLPELIGMKKLAQAQVFEYDGGGNKEDWGYSGFVVITTSHISIHTYPKKGYFAADVFSCSFFDYKKILSQFKKTFKFKTYEHQVIKRGLKFKRNV